MRYFHSNKNFNQYKPPESFWSKFKKNRRKREIVPNQATGTLVNPFKKEVPKPKSYKKIIITAFILTLFIGWVALMLTLPYFKINKIEVVGTKISRPNEVEDYIRFGDYFKPGLVCRQNYFLFPDKTVANKIQQQFLYQKTEIQKIFPDTIRVIVTEKPASIIYDNNGTIYLLDVDGKLIKKTEFSYTSLLPNQNFASTSTITASSTTSTFALSSGQITAYQATKKEYGNFPVIFDNKPTDLSKDVLSTTLIQTASSWEKYLTEQAIGQTQFFSTDETDFDLRINLDKPWHILVNTKNDLNTQMRNLKLILSGNKPTGYIDLRFDERVYWK